MKKSELRAGDEVKIRSKSKLYTVDGRGFTGSSNTFYDLSYFTDELVRSFCGIASHVSMELDVVWVEREGERFWTAADEIRIAQGMVQQKSKLEIIEETVDYYRVNPRGTISYCDSAGCMCAVGRCLWDAQWMQDMAESINLYSIKQPAVQAFCKFRPEYAGHCWKFWSQLQNLHDSHDNWGTSGLSHGGMLAVELLKEAWC